jgi:hypothetical protein
MGLIVFGLGSLILIEHNLNFDPRWYLAAMIVGGTVAGFVEGKRWWRIIYVEKAYLRWPKHKHETKLLGLLILIILTVAVLFLMNNK